LESENSCFPANDTGRYLSYHEGGSVKEEYACRRGKPAGTYTKKDPEGSVAEKGAFDAQGRKQGVWETFLPGGKTASRRIFAAGLERDSGFAWDEAGRLRERSHFAAGTGERLRYDSLGNLVQRSRFVSGVPDGPDWMYWPASAALGDKADASRPGGRTGPDDRSAPAPGPKRQCMVFADGKPLSLKRWHRNGRAMAEGHFENGKRAGEWKEWWEDGTLKEISRYLAGDLHGERLFYDRSGRLMLSIRYERGYPAEGRIPKALARGEMLEDSGAILRPAEWNEGPTPSVPP
jgi:antitoxin component YwqK of YwqJK toxin-antitoxin module